jgi:hypothetical protein
LEKQIILYENDFPSLMGDMQGRVFLPSCATDIVLEVGSHALSATGAMDDITQEKHHLFQQVVFFGLIVGFSPEVIRASKRNQWQRDTFILSIIISLIRSMLLFNIDILYTFSFI